MEGIRLKYYIDLFFKKEEDFQKELEDEDFNKIKEIFEKYHDKNNENPKKKLIKKQNYKNKTIISRALYIKSLQNHGRAALAQKNKKSLLSYCYDKPELKTEVLNILEK